MFEIVRKRSNADECQACSKSFKNARQRSILVERFRVRLHYLVAFLSLERSATRLAARDSAFKNPVSCNVLN